MPLHATFKPLKRATLEMMGIPQVRTEMLNELRKLGREATKELEGAFSTWDHKPKVNQRIHLTRTDPEAGVEISTDDEIANWVDQGTPGHMILPKYRKRLSWKSGYNRKSRVGSLKAYDGGKFGDYAHSSGHWVSGIRARKFSYTLERWLSRKMSIRLQEAANRGAKKAHG
jgi:hypothetical protein